METLNKQNDYLYCFYVVKHKRTKYLLTQFAKPRNENTSEALYNWLTEYLTLNADYSNVITDVSNYLEQVQSSDKPSASVYLQGKKSCLQITKEGIHVFDTYYECTEELNKQYQMKINTNSFMKLLYNYNSYRLRMEKGDSSDNIELPNMYNLEQEEFNLK